MKLQRRFVVALVVVVILVTGVAVGIRSTRRTAPKFRGPPQQIRLGTIPAALSAFIWIAEDQGYFVESGLDVTITLYESGHLAIRDLLAGSLDIATATEFPVVRQSLEQEDLRVLASIDKFDTLRVVARTDRGVREISDLKGKKIGVAKGSSAQFCLASLLILSSIPSQDVHPVYLSPSQQVAAIVNGELDAVLVWEPFVQQVKDALGKNVLTLPAQSDQDQFWLVVSRGDLVGKRPEAIRRFLSALLAAEEFLASHQSDAKAILKRRLGFETEYLESLWRMNSFGVTLPQALVLAMEDQARWMMTAMPTKRTEIPDFLDHICLTGLKRLKPDAISIIHREGER